MDEASRDVLRGRLLEEWQRGFPLVARPFCVIADRLDVRESDVIACLKELKTEGVISRVGAVVRPNTLGASTLAAIAAPESAMVTVASMIAAEPGANHVYLREGQWNIWFVVTGPDRDYVDQTLQRIEKATGLRLLDLRLERAYHIDLGFSLNGVAPARRRMVDCPQQAGDVLQPGDRELAQILTEGLPLISRPFEDVAMRLGRTESQVIARLTQLSSAGILPRVGVIVRHRALGWRSNAMVAWKVSADEVDRAGRKLARAPGVNLCYRRAAYADCWPYNLYCMVHAKTRGEALYAIETAQAAAGLGEFPRQVLFSVRCFKQTGAMIARPMEAA